MFFLIMMKKWLLLKNIPISRPECKNFYLFMTKISKIETLFMTKTAAKPYPLGRTYLYRPYKGVPPIPRALFHARALDIANEARSAQSTQLATTPQNKRRKVKTISPNDTINLIRHGSRLSMFHLTFEGKLPRFLRAIVFFRIAFCKKKNKTLDRHYSTGFGAT